jgi:hypothetical protein
VRNKFTELNRAIKQSGGELNIDTSVALTLQAANERSNA